MPWGSGVYLQIHKEVSFGVTPAWTSPITIELSGDNAFKMRKVPTFRDIRTAHRGNRRSRRVSNRYGVRGSLTTLLYPSQTQVLLDWGLKLTSNELDSYTVRYFDTVVPQEFPGVKVKQLSLAASADSNEGEVQATFELWGQKKSETPTWTAPTASDFPAEDAWAITDTCGGGLELGASSGAARAKYRRLALEVVNELGGGFDECPYISSLVYSGRDINWEFEAQFLNNNDRGWFEAQTLLTGELTFTQGGKSLAFDFNAANVIDDHDIDLPLNGIGYQTIRLSNLVDPADGADIAYTVDSTA